MITGAELRMLRRRAAFAIQEVFDIDAPPNLSLAAEVFLFSLLCYNPSDKPDLGGGSMSQTLNANAVKMIAIIAMTIHILSAAPFDYRMDSGDSMNSNSSNHSLHNRTGMKHTYSPETLVFGLIFCPSHAGSTSEKRKRGFIRPLLSAFFDAHLRPSIHVYAY